MGEGASTPVLVTWLAVAGNRRIELIGRGATHRSPSHPDGGPTFAANVVDTHPARVRHAPATTEERER